MTHSADTDGRPAAPARPWWIGFALIALGGVWLYGASQLSQTAQYAVIGPGLALTVIGIGLVALGAVLLWQISRGEEFAPQDAEDAMANAPADRIAFWTATAAAGIPVLVMPLIGFPLTAALSFTLVTRAFGSRRIAFDLVIGFVIGMVCFFGFEQLGIDLGGFIPLLGR